MTEAEAETPWAAVKRLRAGGASFDEVAVALRHRGLSRDDIELLLEDDPAFQQWRRGQPPPEPAPTAAPREEPPADWARVGRWTGLTVSALASGGAAAVVPGALGVVVLLGLAVPAVILARGEYARARGRTLRDLGFVLFFAYVLPALAWFISGATPARVVSATLLLGSVPLLWWATKRARQLPGLPEHGVPEPFELDGVQFGIVQGDGPVGVGGYAWVLVRAQNVLDAPRALTVRIQGLGRSGVQPQRHEVPLEPGVIRDLLVPVRAPALADGTLSFRVAVEVTGSGVGPRLRLARGAAWTQPADQLVDGVVGLVNLARADWSSLGDWLGNLVDVVDVAGAGARWCSTGTVTVKLDAERPYTAEPEGVRVVDCFRPDPAALRAAARG